MWLSLIQLIEGLQRKDRVHKEEEILPSFALKTESTRARISSLSNCYTDFGFSTLPNASIVELIS